MLYAPKVTFYPSFSWPCLSPPRHPSLCLRLLYHVTDGFDGRDSHPVFCCTLAGVAPRAVFWPPPHNVFGSFFLIFCSSNGPLFFFRLLLYMWSVYLAWFVFIFSPVAVPKICSQGVPTRSLSRHFPPICPPWPVVFSYVFILFFHVDKLPTSFFALWFLLLVFFLGSSFILSSLAKLDDFPGVLIFFWRRFRFFRVLSLLVCASSPFLHSLVFLMEILFCPP